MEQTNLFGSSASIREGGGTPSVTEGAHAHKNQFQKDHSMNLIVVVDNKWGIGKNNNLLFSLKKDMAFFRQTTTGKVVVMGAKTFQTFPNGALPNRVNIVLDHQGNNHDGATTVTTVEDLFALLQNYNTDDVFVIGGATVYKLLLNHCQTAYVTKVQADGDAEVFFPNLDEMESWQLVETSEDVQDGNYTINFCKYVQAK